jgi:hypothetical protein
VADRNGIRRRQLVCVLFLALASPILAEPAPARPQVLLIFDEDKDLPGLSVINRNVQQVLRDAFEEGVEFYSESLQLSQFNDAEHQDAMLEKIFEHFVSSKPHGLGMGLAISRSIVDAHGGLIWATRNDGRGLTLHVELPSVDADADPAEEQSERVSSTN